MRLQIVAVIVSSFTIGIVQAKAADTPSKVFTSYGLTGSWSAACQQPAGPRNPRIHFELRPDGLVDNVGDNGDDGPSRSTILEALIDQEHRLHTTSYTRFSDLPKSMRESIGKSGAKPNVTRRGIYVLGSDGSFNTDDQIVEMEIEGSSRTMHVISGGFIINQKTQEPGPKVPTAFRCSE